MVWVCPLSPHGERVGVRGEARACINGYIPKTTVMHPLTSIGIIGNGAFGALTATLIRKHAPHIAVRVFSSRREPDGATFFSLPDAAQCDAVVLCTPISTFTETLTRVVAYARPDTVIVDVSTVKMHTAMALERYAAGRPYLATHPMFGPESYRKKGERVDGFRIVVAKHTLPAGEYDALRSFLEQCGFVIIEKTPEQHDRELAETLFLTHLVGQAVARAGFSRTSIDTVSFGFLMDAVESVKNDTALFTDVYHFNPFCQEVLTRFTLAEQEVRNLLEK